MWRLVSPRRRFFRRRPCPTPRRLKLDREIGTVEVGKRANLLLLRDRPDQNDSGLSRNPKGHSGRAGAEPGGAGGQLRASI